MLIAGRVLAFCLAVLTAEPPIEDEVLTARAGAAQDGLLLCTEDLEPATDVFAIGQASGLHAVEAVIQQIVHHKPADELCHR